MSHPDDPRQGIYNDLHHRQLRPEEQANRVSAEFILSRLFQHYPPKSVLDVGCGIGTWLAVAQQLGASEVVGIEGAWLDRQLAQIPARQIVTVDMEQPFDLARRFDLVISVEVAEHLSPAAADAFVASLVLHAQVILFSAAIPFQGGHHHVNEQFLDYWSQRFAAHAYRPVDFLRSQLWDHPQVLWWLKQNLVVFAHESLTTGAGALAHLVKTPGPLSIVHPKVYLDRVGMSQKLLDDHHNLIALLATGSTFSVSKQPNGELTITRLS